MYYILYTTPNKNMSMFMSKFNLKTTMVSVFDKELEYKVEKLKYKTF